MRLNTKQIELLDELFDDSTEYFHYQTALKIFDTLGIKYDACWVRKKFSISFNDDESYDQEKIIKFLNVAKRVCSDCADGYLSDSGDALNAVFVLRDTIEILES